MLGREQSESARRRLNSRRAFLRAGALGVGGLGLADLLRSDARATATHRPKSLIYVVLSGGPSHIDMYDLKPDAPDEYRGPFRPINTSLVGAQICELMPQQARLMDRLALIRGIRSVENDHFLQEVYSGYTRFQGKHPCFGSVVSRLTTEASRLPKYVSVGSRPASSENDHEQPYYVGAGYAPFRPFAEALDDLAKVESLQRLSDRRSLLAAFDDRRRLANRVAAYEGIDRFQQQALEIITSSEVRDAFDLSKEPRKTFEAYGDGAGKYTHQTVKRLLYPWEAKKFVLARRLVEAGARIVTVQIDSWDHHSGPEADIFYSLQQMLPCLDRSLAALFQDLTDRGLDKDVAVVVLGEFGRTPKIVYPGPGREHWAEAGCAMVFGGGLKMGQVIGATDARADRSVDGKIMFQNILATIYRLMGIDLETALPDFNGRPQYLLDDREPIAALFG